MQQILQTLMFVAPMSFLAGLIDSIAGGGGLISLPTYLAVGLPAHLAAGTNKCTAMFGTAVAATRYIRKKKIHWPSTLAAMLGAFPGAAIGTRLNLLLDDHIMQIVMMVLLPVVGIALALRPNFGENETWQTKTLARLALLSLVIGFAIGVYDGFFGPGTGTFLLLAFSAICGFDLITANGNTKVINLTTNVSSFLTFALSGSVWYAVALPAALCNMAGGWVGSGLALTKGAKVIRPVYYIVLTLLLCKIVFDFVA